MSTGSAKTKKNVKTDYKMKMPTYMLLTQFSLRPDNMGFHYIGWVLETYGYGISMQKFTAVYEHCGKAFGVTGTSVERCMRHAIEVASVVMGEEERAYIFGNSIGNTETPTVSHFLSCLGIIWDDRVNGTASKEEDNTEE